MSETLSEPIYMLNVLWFEEDGGAQKYGEYAAAAAPFLKEAGARVLEGYTPETAVIGEWDPDLFFVVEWPSWEAFLELTQSPEYREVVQIREEALRDSLLIRCSRRELALPE